ncbi:MAG: TIGR03936 family radical SAM-associated protein [Chloroflexota bacterium]
MTDPNQAPPKPRIRLHFAKKSQVKYISHLDLALSWERALRRAQIPLAYSQGFNPRPKMQVASGLPLGTTGRAEIMDITLTESIDLETSLERIQATLPVGIGLHAIEEIPARSPALQSLLRQAEYEVIVETDLSEMMLTDRIQTLLEADQILQTRIRRKKEETFDLRPWVHDLRLISMTNNDAQLYMRLTAGQFGNLRPEQLLKALGLEDNWANIERTRLIFEA